MKPISQIKRLIPPGILVAVLTGAYGFTLAPGLTWANDGMDGGDLIAAAATGGIPHPTGYPVYLLLAELFQKLPFGPLAFRTNLLSMLATIGAALLIYVLTSRFLESSGASTGRPAGLASALVFGLSPLVWSQAIITEVYALHAFFIALILYLSSDLAQRFSRKQLDCLSGLVFGLGMGNHATTILLLPVIFTPVSVPMFNLASAARPRFSLPLRFDARASFRRIGFTLLGLTPYFILPLRALSNPPVNWGRAATWKGFFWLVSGRLYQPELFSLTFAEIWERAQSAVTMLFTQFGVAGLFLGLVGLIVFFSSIRLYWNMIWITFVFSAFAVGYGAWDSYVYLIPVFLCFAIWIGMALGRLMEKLRSPGRSLIFLAFCVYLAFFAAYTRTQVDASHDQRAEQFGQVVLLQAPKDALLFAKGDGAVFALWYFHYALRQRPDVVVIASDLLHYDWYQQTLQDTYPSLQVPGPFPFEETIRLANPSRPACYVEYSQMLEMECLEPVN